MVAIQALGGVEEIIRAANSGGEWPIAERFKQKIIDSADDIRLYKKLTTIKLDVGMELIPPTKDKKRLIMPFMAYKCRSLCAPNELTGLVRMAG